MISLKRLQNRQEKFNSKKDGSISVFLALTLTIILAFLFSTLEAARVNGLKSLAIRRQTMEMQSLFGAYNQELWEHYGLLFLDMSYGSGEPDVRLMEGDMMENDYARGEEAHFYQLALKDVQVEGYALATDREGAEFKRQACEAVSNQLAQEEIEELESRIEEWQELETQGEELEKNWDEVLDAEKEVEEYEDETTRAEENPMEYVAQLKASSLLALVMEDSFALSGKGVADVDSVGSRELFCGNMQVKQSNAVDKSGLVKYLNQYFSCKTDTPEQEHVLDYELEYCIGGKSTDMQNLETVVKKLLLIREGANFVTIMQDAQKKAQALEIAVSVVGFTGNIPLIKAVEKGILLAWCYVESVMDLRSLLSGGKVPLIKDSSQWKSDLFHIQESFSQESSEESENGLEYREYLQMLLYMTGEKELTYRAMEVIEQNIRLFSGNEAIRMDTMVSAVQINMVYSARPLFLTVFPVAGKIEESYRFENTQRLVY